MKWHITARIWAILSLFTAFTVSLSHSATLSEIRTEIRRNLRDTDSSRQRYTDPQLLDFINQAQREIVNATWLSEETTSYTLSPRTTYYTLPATLIAVTYVDLRQRGSDVVSLKQKTRAGLESTIINWQFQSGQPVYYYVEQSSNSKNYISYIPIPTSLSTGTVTVKYINRVNDLSSDTDVPFNNQTQLYSYHNTIVYYATFRLMLIERKYSEAKLYSDLYIQSLSIAKERIRTLPDYSPGINTR